MTPAGAPSALTLARASRWSGVDRTRVAREGTHAAQPLKYLASLPLTGGDGSNGGRSCQAILAKHVFKAEVNAYQQQRGQQGRRQPQLLGGPQGHADDDMKPEQNAVSLR